MSHVQLVAAANRTADLAEAVVATAWSQVLGVLQDARSHCGNYLLVLHRLRPILDGLRLQLPVLVGNQLVETAAATHTTTATSLASKIPERKLNQPAKLTESLDVGEYLFGPLNPQTLHQILFSSDWSQRLSALTRLAAPELLSSILSNGIQQGKTIDQIARDLRPHLQGVQTSARRVARTETVRVAHEVQFDAWEQVGDLIVGYQIHAVHGNPNTRKWHLSRDGTIYYKDPKPGQKGLRQMPKPPAEAEDPSERPPNAPRIAPNCLCYLTPVFGE